MQKIRVLIVHCSAVIARAVEVMVNQTADMQCIAAVSDSDAASQQIAQLKPDLIALDNFLSREQRVEFFRQVASGSRQVQIMVLPPLSQCEPSSGGLAQLATVAAREEEILTSLRLAALPLDWSRPNAQRIDAAGVGKAFWGKPVPPTLIIGASTGGTEAVKSVLQAFPEDVPPILVAQHMLDHYTHSFAGQLDRACRVTVKEAEHEEKILPGHAYIAPGSCHLRIKWLNDSLVCDLLHAPPVGLHRPSVDVLFRSAARACGRHAVGAILTGMGRDGAVGLLEMRRCGALTLAQDEKTCVVFGMPREAIDIGAVDEVLPLMQIAPRMLKHVSKSL